MTQVTSKEGMAILSLGVAKNPTDASKQSVDTPLIFVHEREYRHIDIGN